MPKTKQLTQEEKDTQTSFWCFDSKNATDILTRIHNFDFKISCHVESNMLICNRDLDKKEYKKLFPIVKSNLL